MMATRLSPRRRSTISPVAVFATKWSGLTSPGLGEAGVYDSLTALPRDRVRSKQDAGDRRVDHPLHDDGEAHAVWVDPVRSPVADGAVRPQRGPAAPHRVEHGLDADHVQIRVLLACEARLWQVLSRSRGTHGHRNRLAVSQTLVFLR